MNCLLPALLLTIVIALSGTQLAGGSLVDAVLSRRTMLMKIGGDVSEQRIYLERCTQSSVYESCIFALDDDINQESWSGECAVTTADMRPWWEARTENPAYISKVVIYGLEKVNERGVDALTDFELLASDHVCIRYKSYSSFLNKTFACDTFADRIRVQSNLDHSVLAICEIVAYGKLVRVDLTSNGTAPIKLAKCVMSSTLDAHRCHLAMDDNLEQDAGKGFCAVTNKEPTPWLEVLLEQPAIVRLLKVFNRVDCCQDQLNNFEVFVNGQLCHKFDRVATFSVHEFPCGRFGDRVRITNAKVAESGVFLPLCEIQLFGFPVLFHSFSSNKYIGCFREKKRARDLQNLVAINHMTAEKCERMCRRRKMPFFGLQLGKQCWCSERYGLYGRSDEEACWMQCDSSAQQACGAKLQNSVFEISDLAASRQ